MIQILKKYIRGDRIFTTGKNPKWISNGHWMIRSRVIVNKGLFANADIFKEFAPTVSYEHIPVKKAESELDRVKKSHKWENTNWQNCNPGGETRVCVYRKLPKSRLNMSVLAIFNCDYIEMLGFPQCLWGASNSDPFANSPKLSEIQFLVMPILCGQLDLSLIGLNLDRLLIKKERTRKK